jgi:protein farnesyltransferase/geranylgeranyltransferase type-1 subunit alpha
MDAAEDEKLLYSQRPEWADVLPLEQYENITPLAPIFYTDECEHISLFAKCRSKH